MKAKPLAPLARIAGNRTFLFSAAAAVVYAGIATALLLLERNVSLIQWATLLPSVLALMIAVPAFSILFGIAGGFWLAKPGRVVWINAAAVALFLVVLLVGPSEAAMENAMIAAVVLIALTLLTLLAESAVRLARGRRAGKRFSEIFPPATIGQRNVVLVGAVILLYAAMGILFFALGATDEHGWNELEVTTVFVAGGIPLLSLLTGALSGALLESWFVVPSANAACTVFFLVAIRADKPTMIALGAGVSLLLALGADRAAHWIRATIKK